MFEVGRRRRRLRTRKPLTLKGKGSRRKAKWKIGSDLGVPGERSVLLGKGEQKETTE